MRVILQLKKVGIKLTDRNNTPVTLDKPFDPNVDPRITVNADGTGTFNLKAYYYTWDKDNAEAGDGNATARVYHYAGITPGQGRHDADKG